MSFESVICKLDQYVSSLAVATKPDF